MQRTAHRTAVWAGLGAGPAPARPRALILPGEKPSVWSARKWPGVRGSPREENAPAGLTNVAGRSLSLIDLGSARSSPRLKPAKSLILLALPREVHQLREAGRHAHHRSELIRHEERRGESPKRWLRPLRYQAVQSHPAPAYGAHLYLASKVEKTSTRPSPAPRCITFRSAMSR